MASCTVLDVSLFKWTSSPKTAPIMHDLLSRIDGLAKRMPILINHHRSLLVVRHLFNAMERDFCVPCSARRTVSRSASSHTTASEYWPRLNLLLMTFKATLHLLSSPRRTASTLSTSMTLLEASVTLITPCAYGASNTAMTTLSADSPAFSARKSSGHKYATEGHGFGKPSHLLAHPIIEAEDCAGSSSGALHIPHTTKRIGRLLGSEMAVKADERERDFALSVHGRNDPPQAVPCISKQLLAQRLPGSPPLEPLEDLLQPDLLPLVIFSSMSTVDQSPLISAFRTVSTTFSGRWSRGFAPGQSSSIRRLPAAHTGFVFMVPQKAAVSSKFCRSTVETSWINV